LSIEGVSVHPRAVSVVADMPDFLTANLEFAADDIEDGCGF